METQSFKIWDRINKYWIIDDPNHFVEFNYVLPGYEGEGDCFVDEKHGMNVEIVWKDENGNFIKPE